MSNIEQLGQKIDERLAAQGLTLTQGGEPTYVPRRPLQPEWNTEALGPEKLPFARRLGQTLVQSCFNGAVAVKLQGKQYPGESLPRWALALYRRREGAPLWQNSGHLQWDQTPMRRPGPDSPRQLLESLARSLGLETAPQPVFEDVAAWLWREHPEQAAQLRFSVQRALNLVRPPESIDCRSLSGWETVSKPAGWVLPLDFVDGRWVSKEWCIPGESEIGLLSGDSPVGLRLPLFRLPPSAIRRAITAEVKQGELTVFLPPCPSFDTFADLVARLESVVTEGRLPPLALEGYPPPYDAAWESLSLTSDPGVIEVNLPPAASFGQLSHYLRTLHQAATRIGLKGSKLTFNGRCIGTGGGAHLLFGGASLETNPFVLRPHLLASLLRFLLAHPSLSYGFSGLYLGPSSQAPRPDETVPGVVDELEIAVTVLDSLRGPADPAFLDRLLRSLLLDWNGNTHRAEVCVDKFCNPFAPNGRLGVVELRAIEMLPDLEANLAVNLLFRALIVALLEAPCRGPLKRWEPSRRERLLLPAALAEDLQEVVAFLNERQMDFPFDLLEPILEFRFPVLHTWESGSGRLEIRQALDFWCAMGDAGGGTSRRVDAATDRIEIRLTGGLARSAEVLVNGWRLTLEPGWGEMSYGGVRYQAFTNDFGLHPHLKPHIPLIIDLIDRESGTVGYACRYSPWKLDGGYYAAIPKDEAEARERVAARSQALPDRIGMRITAKQASGIRTESATLDLRVAREEPLDQAV